MKSSLPKPTKAEERRFYIIKFEICCLVHKGRPAEAHHLLSVGRRISHAATIPLCEACHTGKNSTHKRRKWFAEHYGTDNDLLKETNRRVALFEANTVGRAA